VIAHTIRQRKALGGINMTASHNPAEYQGLKFSTCNGAPATQDVTRQIESNIIKLQESRWSFAAAPFGAFQCRTFNPQPDYFKQLRRLVDFETIAKTMKAEYNDNVDLRRKWGGGIMGQKSNHVVEKREKAIAIEQAKKLGLQA
jgi:phosphoglucomutase